MGLFKRIGDNIRANINSVLSKVEDPKKLLDQYVIDMETEITEVKAAVVGQMTTMNEIKFKRDEAQASIQKREEYAMTALKKGDEVLARRAIAEKQAFEQSYQSLEIQYQNARKSADELKIKLTEMKTAYQEMKTKRDTLTSRIDIARAEKKVNQVLNKTGRGGARDGFERMESRVLTLEAEAVAHREIAAHQNALDELSTNRLSVDQELEKLKVKLQQ